MWGRSPPSFGSAWVRRREPTLPPLRGSTPDPDLPHWRVDRHSQGPLSPLPLWTPWHLKVPCRFRDCRSSRRQRCGAAPLESRTRGDRAFAAAHLRQAKMGPGAARNCRSPICRSLSAGTRAGVSTAARTNPWRGTSGAKGGKWTGLAALRERGPPGTPRRRCVVPFLSGAGAALGPAALARTDFVIHAWAGIHGVSWLNRWCSVGATAASAVAPSAPFMNRPYNRWRIVGVVR